MVELITDYFKYPENDQLNEEEMELLKYIGANSPNENYSSILENDSRFYIRYHLSDNRASILRWYSFKEDASVLEIGGEFGALTGALCDSCDSVTVVENSLLKARAIAQRYEKRNNLSVVVGTIDDIVFNKKYDYIVCFRELEYVKKGYSDYLQKLENLLTEDGIVLLEVDNQYGIKYMSGQKEIHSNIPFDSFAAYPNKDLGKGFNRAELIDIIKNSNFEKSKFLYPFPDYIAPRAIYSDSMLPTEASIERLVTYYDDASTMVADDISIYKDIIANGVFSFASNSFIVELGKVNSRLSEISSVILSGYRSRDKAFATIITENNQIMKKGLFRDSCEYVAKLKTIVEELCARKIPVLPINNNQNCIEMDYISYPTVMDYLRQLVSDNKDKYQVIHVFEMLWRDILLSSDVLYESDELGPVLEKAYLEMIPMNSFWINENEILYFDQEYVKEGCPARYVLYRGIIHSIGMVSGLDTIISNDELFDIFGISSYMKKIFSEMEKDLEIAENPMSVFCDGISDKYQQKYNRDLLNIGR